jgi:hypothetical protein
MTPKSYDDHFSWTQDSSFSGYVKPKRLSYYNHDLFTPTNQNRIMDKLVKIVRYQPVYNKLAVSVMGLEEVLGGDSLTDLLADHQSGRLLSHFLGNG